MQSTVQRFNGDARNNRRLVNSFAADYIVEQAQNDHFRTRPPAHAIDNVPISSNSISARSPY